MCKFNVMCQVIDGSCSCCEMPFIPQVVRPMLPAAPSDSSLLYHLYGLITQQNEVIRTLAEQTNSALIKVEMLSKGLETNTWTEQPSNIVISREEVTTSDHIVSILSSGKSSHSYSLRLVSDLPQPAYKERAFSLMIEIVNQNNEKISMPIPVNFKIMLFTTESPPKLLKVNTSGDKIMRGTVEVESSGVIFFRKIVIKEVTSHFRNGCFFLVVMPKNSNEIKPLVIENFVIKARKILTSDPVKKMKTEDSTDETVQGEEI